MGTDLQQQSADARRLFDLADEVTGLPITRLCAEGPLERLTETDVAQPAVVATSLAALAVLRERASIWTFAAVAGHSVGEYAAYVAAGVFDAETALRLVQRARAGHGRGLRERRRQHGRGHRPRRGAAARGVRTPRPRTAARSRWPT